MMRSPQSRFLPGPRAALLTVLALAACGLPAPGQEAAEAKKAAPGQFITIEEPIDDAAIERVDASARQVIEAAARQGATPYLIFEIRPGTARPGQTKFGSAYEMANLISTRMAAAYTVAYVPEPLTGYASLVALACRDIVMGPESSLGPITPEGQEVNPDVREPTRLLARRTGKSQGLLLGMVDKDADLRAFRTADKQLHFVFAAEKDEFAKANQVLDDQPAWEAGRRGVLTAARGRQDGLIKLVADNKADVATQYNLAGRGTADDPTLGQALRPVWIQVQGPIDTIKESYLRRRIDQARQEKVNLLFFQIDSKGGLDKAADNVADVIANIKDMKTVAFVDESALGVSALIPLACDEIVLKRGALMGNVDKLITGRGDRTQKLSEVQVTTLSRRAAALAAQKGHPAAIARAMVDPEAEVVRATDGHSGAVILAIRSEIAGDPGRYTIREVVKAPGSPLTVTEDDAAAFGLARVVSDAEEFKSLYGLRGKTIRVDGPTWVDALVTTLNDPFVSTVLLFVGFFMLVLELKLPGIGLPGIASALSFLLFFWSRYLSGTADQLEVILFLVGMICLALELFVFPGFGVFGMSGILLILVSIVMASHTFIWPTQEYEYRQLMQTLIQIAGLLTSVSIGAVVLARYFPSMPIFNRFVLKPEPWDADADPDAKPAVEGYDSLAFLVGETGRTSSVLRPSGKARFGDLLIDVTADGFYIEADSLVEVVDVQGSRVIVKRHGT